MYLWDFLLISCWKKKKKIGRYQHFVTCLSIDLNKNVEIYFEILTRLYPVQTKDTCEKLLQQLGTFKMSGSHGQYREISYEKIALQWSPRSRTGQPSTLVKPSKNTQISSEKYFQFTI
jgi:hypothetical protein